MFQIEKKYRNIFLVMLLNFILFGISLTIVGATLPRIIRNFGWSYVEIGFVLCAGSVGYFLSSFVFGILLDYLGAKKIIVSGLLLQSLGLLLFGYKAYVFLNFILFFIVGVGQGGMEVVVNYSVVRIERYGKSQLMNLMHAAFSIGAVIGPFVDVILMRFGLGWQSIYRLMGILAVLMALASSALKLSEIDQRMPLSTQGPKKSPLFRDPLLILCFLILLIYVGSELGVSNWISEYYVKFFGTSDRFGSMMVSIFWIGLLLGRLIISMFYRGSQQAIVALVLSVICSISVAVAVQMGHPFGAGAFFTLAGLGYSAIYPLIMAVVGRSFQNNQGTAIGFAATGGGIGSFTFPFIMAYIANRFGIRGGFYVYVSLNVLMSLLIASVVVLVRKKIPSNEILVQCQR